MREEAAKRSWPIETVTENTRKVDSLKKGFYHFPRRTGSQLIAESSEVDESPVAQPPRAKKRKACGYSEIPLALVDEMKISTTDYLGTYVKMPREAARSTAIGAKELARRRGPGPGASAMKERRMAALGAENETLRKEVATLAAFVEFLDGVDDCVRRHLPQQVLVLGGFNVRFMEWGNSRT